MRESTIENYLVEKTKQAEGEIRKLSWIGRRNAPDRLVGIYGFHPLVELKRPTKTATKAQKREHDRLEEMGFEVWVLNTKSKIDHMFFHYEMRSKAPL